MTVKKHPPSQAISLRFACHMQPAQEICVSSSIDVFIVYCPVNFEPWHSGKASLEVLVSKDQWYGVTYPEDKQSVIDALAKLRDDGVYKF